MKDKDHKRGLNPILDKKIILEQIKMTNKNEIEIIFDIEEKTYHAIWSPPLSIGAGNSEIAALKDMKEALLFYLNTLIKSKQQKTQIENQEL